MSVTSPSIQNAYGIIVDALMDAGKLRLGDDPDSETIAQNTRRLNKLILLYITRGCKLFLVEQKVLTLFPPVSNQVGVALYTLGPSGNVPMAKPYGVISAYYTYANGGNQYPLISMSYPDEYERLSNLLQPGPVNSYAVDKQPLTLNVYLWNPPDAFTAANGTVLLMIKAAAVQFNGITDTMSFPIEWSLALEWGLADLAAVGQPPLVQAKCKANAASYLELLENWDVEDADTMFQPDQRMAQDRGKFR
jgi:hypothetical protein